MRLPVLLSMLIAAVPQALPAASSRPVVAVIDSGIARTPELDPWLVAEYDMASETARPSFRPRYDHGTMVATILVREARMPVDIISFRIDDPAGCPPRHMPPCQPSPEPVAAAIRKATSLGVDAINLSLALQDHPLIVDAVRDAAAHDVLVILAAGNEGLDHPGNLSMATAAYPKAVLVGALDDAGHPWRGTNRPRAGDDSYNYSWQRGVDVPTVLADGASGWATGTSFAAPAETARRLNEAAHSPAAQAPVPSAAAELESAALDASGISG